MARLKQHIPFAALLIAVVVAVLAAPIPPDSDNARNGYVRIVDNLVQRGALQIRQDGRYRISVDPDRLNGRCSAADTAGNALITPSPSDAVPCYDRVMAFIENSYLRYDLQTLDPVTWKQSINGLLWIEPGSRVARNDDGNETIQVLFSRQNGVEAFAMLDLDTGKLVQFSSVAPLDLCAFYQDAKVYRNTQCPVKDQTIKAGSEGCISLEALSIPFRVNRGENTTFQACPGDIVQIPALNRQAERRLQVVESAPSMTYANQGVVYYDNDVRNIARYLAGSRSSGVIQTTVDQRLQRQAQELLSRQLRGSEETFPATSFRAGAVLMDGVSGEIVALPSFPFVEGDLKYGEEKFPQRARWVEENSNFPRLPIGSTAKLPFSAAIFSTWEDLLDLSIKPDEGRFNQVFGVRFSKDINSHALPGNSIGRMDASHFIAQSSNRYAAGLMVLALAGAETRFSEPAGNWVSYDDAPHWFGTRPMRVRPPGLEPHGRNTGSAWRDNLYTFFCVPSHDKGDKKLWDGRAGNCNPTLWPRADGRPMPIQIEIAPPDLSMETVKDLRNDYVTDILGGGRSTWSNIQLAQSYARIITNTKVQAQLTPADRRILPISLGLTPAVHGTLLTGMHGTVVNAGYRGTARSLEPTLVRKGLVPSNNYYVYAKTGTPTLQLYRPTDALAGLIRARCLRSNAQRTQIDVVKRADCDGLITLEAERRIREANSLPDLGERITTTRDRYVYDVDYTLTDVAILRDGIEGHVFVFAVAQKAAGSDQFCRVRVISVNIQKRNVGLPAMRYVEGLLTDPNTAVFDWLTERCPA